MKYGKLTPVKIFLKTPKYPIWLFRCDCGKEVKINIYQVRSGNTKSCGCIKLESSKKNILKAVIACKSNRTHFTHGMTHTRFYNLYKNIKTRCNNFNRKDSIHYSKKGIKCEWINFEDFKKDMYITYLTAVKKFEEKNVEIERIDNNKNYCKKNCYWIHGKDQPKNTSRTIFFTFNGVKKPLWEWARIYNIKPKTLYERFHRYKITGERLFLKNI